MHAFLMATAFLFVQEATTATSASTRPATIHQMVDVRVQLIGLKQDFEIPEQISNHAEFLADAKTKENILWTTDFRGSTVAGREMMFTTSESVPMIAGISKAGNSTISNISYQQTGTTVRLTPKLEADDRIHLTLHVQASRLHRGAPDLAAEVAVLQQSTSQMLLETEVILKSGQTKTISNSPNNADPKRPAEQALVLITAKPNAE
jgi:hypothetical protein